MTELGRYLRGSHVTREITGALAGSFSLIFGLIARAPETAQYSDNASIYESAESNRANGTVGRGKRGGGGDGVKRGDTTCAISSDLARAFTAER
jgi:hypothetical protein